MEDEGKSQLVLMPLVTLNDDAVETLKMIDPEDRERTHSVLVKPYHNCLEMDSPHLTSYIKDHLLVSPSTAEYNFSRPLDQLNETSLQGEVGQPLEVDQIVYGGELKDGFFIEAGAHDFETNSDSLYFEMKHNWSGLLVEPQVTGLDYKNRRDSLAGSRWEGSFLRSGRAPSPSSASLSTLSSWP